MYIIYTVYTVYIYIYIYIYTQRERERERSGGGPPGPKYARADFLSQSSPAAKMTTALLLKVKVKVKVMEWPNMSPDLNPIVHMWGILKRKVQKHHVSNIQQLRDVIMEEWKRMPATTCESLVNSMPRRIKAVLDNNGAPTKYWHFGHSFDMFT